MSRKRNYRSCLVQATKILNNVILNNVSGIGSIQLSEKDVVRHELVQRIIRAYEKFERTQENNKK
ncbi:MAG: PhoH family protein [Terrisporobacter sp.]